MSCALILRTVFVNMITYLNLEDRFPRSHFEKYRCLALVGTCRKWRRTRLEPCPRRMKLKIGGVSNTYRIFNIKKIHRRILDISDSIAHFLDGVFAQNCHFTVGQTLPADFAKNLSMYS